MSRAIAIFLLVSFASVSWAQVIFEPVRYQYGDKDKFYYGGSDRNVIARQSALENRCGHALLNETSPQLRVYDDARPGENVAIFGCTPADARNEAYANVPRYFRMGDLLAAGERQLDGSIVVPAQALPVGRIVIIPARKVVPAASSHPVLVIPKDLLNQKLFPPSKLAA